MLLGKDLGGGRASSSPASTLKPASGKPGGPFLPSGKEPPPRGSLHTKPELWAGICCLWRCSELGALQGPGRRWIPRGFSDWASAEIDGSMRGDWGLCLI